VTGRLRVLTRCARGTTLNQAMMYGATGGLDVDGKDSRSTPVHPNVLKNKRIKHQATASPIRREHTTSAAAGHLPRRPRRATEPATRCNCPLCT